MEKFCFAFTNTTPKVKVMEANIFEFLIKVLEALNKLEIEEILTKFSLWEI